MDILTHIVVGASASAPLFGNKLGKRVAIVGGISGLAPDMDTLFTFFLNPIDSLSIHRGLTHSLFFISIVAIFCSIIVYYKNRKNALNWGLVVLFTMGSHLLLDLMTSYGTQIFQPFSGKQYSLGNMNIVDPFFTIPVLLGLLFYLFLGNSLRVKSIANVTGLGISLIYAAFTIFNLFHVKQIFRDAFNGGDYHVKKIVVVPSSAGSLLWHGIGISENGWVIGDYSVFDSGKDISLNFYKGDNSLIDSYDQSIIQKLKRYTSGIFLVREDEDAVRMYHLKCYLTQGFELDPNPSAAYFELHKSEDGKTFVEPKMMVAKSNGLNLFMARWKRVLGERLNYSENNNSMIQKIEK